MNDSEDEVDKQTRGAHMPPYTSGQVSPVNKLDLSASVKAYETRLSFLPAGVENDNSGVDAITVQAIPMLEVPVNQSKLLEPASPNSSAQGHSR